MNICDGGVPSTSGLVARSSLWLMQNCSNDVLERALRALESFFVRRMVSGIGVAGLNTWFPRVIEQLEEGGASDIDRRLICTLANGQRETRRWPDDSQFGEALIETPLYERLSPRPRLRTILEALESEMGGKLAPVALKEGLTIEHIMPQNWRKNWPIEKKTQEAQIEAEERRDLIIHTLGNLTLCTSSLGSQMSDGPWKDKKPALRKFGLMMLTNQALEIPGRGWTEKKIRTPIARTRQSCSGCVAVPCLAARDIELGARMPKRLPTTQGCWLGRASRPSGL